ncbi:MAG TPA: hypothetical protein VGD45_02535 [Steroidobacter sp.]|uniref:hypothetical protein n=1 Tax=Steroidobacter sp. TaxID=1978227 RepID=UPI002EDAB497
MRKQVSRWVMAGLLCLLAAGCGGGGGGSGGGGSGGSVNPPPAPLDTTPNAFEFQKVDNATRGSSVTSHSVTITGISAPVPISITDGEYSINGGAFTSSAGTISEGQSLTVRARVSTDYSRATLVRVTVGSATVEFEVVSEVPDYVPDSVAFDGQDVIYLLNNSYGLVFRWSLNEERYLDAYPVGSNGPTPAKMAYSSAHRRLYLGLSTGAIQYIDVTSNSKALVPLANVSGMGGLVAVGNYLLAQSPGSSHTVLDSAGAVTSQGGSWYSSYPSREYAWDPSTSRVYFFRDYTSPNDLHYEVIDQATGQIASMGETPYHGAYSIQPPIRVSNGGQHVLLGSGDIYNQNGLTWTASLGSQIADARWFADDSVVTLTSANNQTTLRRLSGERLTNVEQRTYSGQGVRIVGTDAKMAVIVVNSDAVRISIYVPNDDSDGDGVTNTQDAFPLDAAASVDTDRDGYPDAWNAGRTQSDSTTGLTLDAYPQDSACYLGSHGDGVNCDYGATIPSYAPDQVVSSGDTIYLLSTANKRVYRWSIASGRYINPFVAGINQGFGAIAPTKMAYSSSHQRLYLGYTTGAIRYIDVAAGNGAEVEFANTAMAVGGLAAVGNYVMAQDHSGAWATHYVFSNTGALMANPDWNYYSREYAWDPTTSRVYFFRDDTSPNDLHYEVIDQSNGQITSEGETPYHGSYNIQPPIRVSANGQYVLLGSGDIYNQNGLTWAGSIGSQVADARWFANGTLVTLTTANNQTTLRRLGANLATLEQLTYSGTALRVVGSDSRMAVVVLNNGTVEFHDYVPNNDSDGDGVPNASDAFPLDRAASVDSDRDGYPDAWNPGRTQTDSTTGLTLDAYPQDAACYLVSHGDGVNCNYSATVPNYVPDQVVQQGDIVYLLSTANRRVYRWSIATGTYLNPYVVGIDQGFSTLAPSKMAYSSAHQRLYLGYSTGAIRYIDVSSGSTAEIPFTNTAMGIGGLAAVGNYLLAQDGSGAWGTHYVFSNTGALAANPDWNYHSREFAYDPVTSRVYFFRDGMSPNDLHYEVIDQSNGQITSEGETPYHGSYNIQPPIRVSANGQYVLLGSGDIYNQNGLIWAGSIGMQVADARWFADGSLVTLTSATNQTMLRRLGANLHTLEQLTFTGQALRIVGSDTRMALLIVNNGAVQFHIYVPNDDSDGDGVPNTSDAFPLDRAASVDTDRDGYPDAWNAGRTQSDSTTGLTLDAYPQDAACYLSSHGDGVNCDYGATIPNYVPDQVVTHGDTIYLLSSANRRVYRWSMATGSYLNPYPVGVDQGFTTLAPTEMAYSSAHQRLYLGYSTGAIRYIDLNSSSGIETPYVNIAMSVGGLASVGNYMLAQDGSGAWATHYVIDQGGVIVDQADWNHVSRDYAWDSVSSRVYFFRDGMSPNDLHYEVIDQATGAIASAGETPYHGDFPIQDPIRSSGDGKYVVLGSGDLYFQQSMRYAGSLGRSIKDARWRDNLLIDLDINDRVEIRDAQSRTVLASYQYAGQPVALAFGATETYLVHAMNGATAFVRLPFYDQDSDTLPRWWEQLYGLSDSNPADALTDLDGDGVNNQTEYQNHSSPTLDDTDGDGLTDQQEIVTYSTDPAHIDSDGDGLDDYAEVITHQTDPWGQDTDADSFNDLDEVLYGGDPTDPAGLPQPLTSYSESFENNPALAAWTTPALSNAGWVIDPTTAYHGSASYKTATIPGNNQIVSTRFRGYFAAGQLSFQAKVDTNGCCSMLAVLLDGTVVRHAPGGNQWNQVSIAVPAGLHDIEFRYEKDIIYDPNGDAWIDNLIFTAQ